MDSCELKSPSSQESGLGTMLAADDSLGSLEELTEGVHQQLTTHMDHTRLLQYELDLLRAQLAEKNKLISAQQVSMKQLQETIAQYQREADELRRIFDAEIMAKAEMINILQSDLTDCQHQYAECFQQVVNNEALIADLRDENAILSQKILHLESQFRKRVKEMSTQTDVPVSLPPKADLNSRIASAVTLRHFPETRKACRRSVQSVADFGDFSTRTPPPPPPPVPSGSGFVFPRKFESVRNVPQQETGIENKAQWIDHFQDMMSEIRNLQEELNKPTKLNTQTARSPENCPCHRASSSVSEIWKTVSQERQHRVQLDHNIQLLQLELLEVKNKMQNTKGSSHKESCCCVGRLCCNSCNCTVNNPLHTLV